MIYIFFILMFYFHIVIDVLQFYSRKVTPVSTMGILPTSAISSDPHFIAFIHFDVSMCGWRRISIVTPSIGMIRCNLLAIPHNFSDEIFSSCCKYCPRKGKDSIGGSCKYSGSLSVRVSFVLWNLIKDHSLLVLPVLQSLGKWSMQLDLFKN